MDFTFKVWGRVDAGDEDAIFIAFDRFKVEKYELGGTKPRGTSGEVKVVGQGLTLTPETTRWGSVTECDHGGSIMVFVYSKTAQTNFDEIAFYPYPGVISRDETYALINLLIGNRDGTTLNVALRIYRKALEARERRVFLVLEGFLDGRDKLLVLLSGPD